MPCDMLASAASRRDLGKRKLLHAQFVAQRHQEVAPMHPLDPVAHVQPDDDRNRKECQQLDVVDQRTRGMDFVQPEQQRAEDRERQGRLRGGPAQRDVRHDGRGEDREQAAEQVAFDVRTAGEAREISGHQHQRAGRDKDGQPLHPGRPLPVEQGRGAEIERRQHEAARDRRLDDVLRHDQRVDADAQEVDQRHERRARCAGCGCARARSPPDSVARARAAA